MTPEQLQFSQAIRPLLTRLDRFVAARVDGQHVADICSDVIAVAWQKRSRFALDGLSEDESMLAFLLTTARFQIKNLERKKQVAYRLQPVLQKAGAVPSPEDDALADIAVTAAFAALTAADQEILAMTAWGGLTPPQIAKVLGVTTNNASVKLNRARGRLREALSLQDVIVASSKNSTAKDIN